MPIITIGQAIKTVGWSEATQNAPADIVTFAKEQANKAIPTVMGQDDLGHWVVLCWYSDERNYYVAKIDKLNPEIKSEPKAT